MTWYNTFEGLRWHLMDEAGNAVCGTGRLDPDTHEDNPNPTYKCKKCVAHQSRKAQQ